MTDKGTGVRRVGRGASLALGLLLAATPGRLQGQDGTDAGAARDELMGHFDVAMRKFIALAEAMPAESFTWSPMEGVMEVGQVYMHVAHYNYLYPSQNLGRSLPAGIQLEEMEAVRNKEEVLAQLVSHMSEHLGQSIAYARMNHVVPPWSR